MNNLKQLIKKKTPVWFIDKSEDIYLNIEKYEKKKKFLDLCFNSNLARNLSYHQTL